MAGVKRSADYQLTSENHDDEANPICETGPSIATEEELSKRRLLKVRRNAYSMTSVESSAPTAGGFFKKLSQTPSDPAFANASLSFNAAFGSKSDLSNTTLTAHPAPPRAVSNFAAKLHNQDNSAVNSMTPTFTFGVQSNSPDDAPIDRSKPFSLFPELGGTNTDATNSLAKQDKSAGETKVGQDDKNTDSTSSNLFGANTFNFAGAVRSFMDARKKLEEDYVNNTTRNEKNTKVSGEEDNEDEFKNSKDADSSEKFETQSIVPRSGEVLALAPCKLFVFDSKDKRWLDRGESEAKLKYEYEDKSETTNRSEKCEAANRSSNTNEHCYRLLVRNGYSLNSLIGKNVFVLGKEGPKHIVFSVNDPETGIVNYLLRFTGPNGESNTKKFLEEIKKAMVSLE